MVGLVTVRFVDESAGFLVPGTFEAFRDDLDLTYAQAAAIVVTPALGGLAGAVFGVLADHRSRRVLASGGGFGFACALAAFAAGHSFAVLALGAFAMGLASTALVDASEIALVDAVEEGDLRRALARQNLFGALGDVCGPLLLIAAAAAGIHWRAVFALAAVAVAAYGGFLATLPYPPPHPHRDGHTPLHVLRSVLRDRRVWHLGFLALLLGPLDEPFLGFVIAFGEQVRGESPAVATLLALGFEVGAVLAFSVGTRVVATRSDRGVLVGGALVLLAATLVTVAVPAPPAVLLAGLAFGAAIGAVWLVLQHLVLALRPGEAGTTKAVVSTIEMGALAVPVLIGAVADAHGLSVALLCFAALPVVFAVLANRATRAASGRSG